MVTLRIVRELEESTSLTDVLPDLVLMLRRDGLIQRHIGGDAVGALKPQADATGKRLEAVWPASLATAVRQLTRRAIAQRSTVEMPLRIADRRYVVRVTARGPDRALCVIRADLTDDAVDDPLATTDELRRPRFDRRGFLLRLRETLSLAIIRETPVAVAVVQLDGIADIARVVDIALAEQVLNAAILRLPHESSVHTEHSPPWYLGQLHAGLLALVMETSDRDAIEACVARVSASLREPVTIAGAAFHLTPYSGVAILAQDAASPKSLIRHARSAVAEAFRSGSNGVAFFTDTLKLRSLARLDVVRELRDAIANRDIRLRYVGRYDLTDDRLVASVGYLRWSHSLRGEVHAAEFLGIAEATGLAVSLSRTVLAGLGEDFAAMASNIEPEVRISFGPLRQHLLHDDFVADIQRFLETGGVPPARLELRIAEQTFVAMNPVLCLPLRQLGVQIVVDEMGRGLGSLDRLARAPIWGLQLDRAWVTALGNDEIALKICRAGIGAARALGLTPIATGVDDAARRDALVALGCFHGTGDLFPDALSQFDTAGTRRHSHSPPRRPGFLRP